MEFAPSAPRKKAKTATSGNTKELAFGAVVPASNCEKYSLKTGMYLVLLGADSNEGDQPATSYTFVVCPTESQAAALGSTVASATQPVLCPDDLRSFQVTKGSFRFITAVPLQLYRSGASIALANDGVQTRDDANPTLATTLSDWPHDRSWHEVIISHTARPTKKKDQAELNPDAQASMINGMIASIETVLYSKLKRTAPRPVPGDPNLYLVWHLAMAEKGLIKNRSHGQEILIVMSAYPIATVSAMDVALARRARGETRRARERAIRMQQEKETVDAIKKYVAKYAFDRGRATLNSVFRVCDPASKAKMMTYPAKDYGEDSAVWTSLVNDGDGGDRALTEDEMMQLCTEAHTYAASDRNAYKKVLQPKHIYLTDSNADMRVSHYFARDHISHFMPALETGIKNLLILKIAKIDMKGLPKLHNSQITDSLRRNLMLMIDEDPDILITHPEMICEVWSGDALAIDKLHNRTKAYRTDKNLPCLKAMHKTSPKELALASRTGVLHGANVPVRKRAFRGKVLIVDYSMTHGTASDCKRRVQQEHYEVHERMAVELLSAQRSSWAAAAATEHILRAGLDFMSFSSHVFSDIQRTGLTHILRRLDEQWSQSTGVESVTDLSDVPPAMPVHLMEQFVATVDDVSPYACFEGVHTYASWLDAFVDTITHADDEVDHCIVHVAIVRDETSQHAYTVAWQMSREQNLELLRTEMEHRAQAEGMDLSTANDNAFDDGGAMEEQFIDEEE